MRGLIVTAAAIALLATPALAAPTGCQGISVDRNSPVIGRWTLGQDDDGPQARAGGWTVAFKKDGTFVEDGEAGGSWCVVDGVLLFSFDEAPHTTYRGAVNARSIRGTESWDGGGTGVFDLQRLAD